LPTTECSQPSFDFAPHFSRDVIARFDGGAMTSDAGGLLLRETAARMNLFPRLAACFLDGRDPARVEHSVEEMVAQRVYGLALGYEDLNDHEQLRHDPLLRVMAGPSEQALAGKSTLNRMELGDGSVNRYKKITFWKAALEELLVDLFLEAHDRAPAEIVLDVDTTDLPLHGDQEGKFFHGYYDHYCYLPLYVFCGEHILCCRLRPANIDAAAGSRKELERIVKQIRARWPEVRLILRGDSGFCRDELMTWCEQNHVEYVLGLARNPRLRAIIDKEMTAAREQAQQSGKAQRVFQEFEYETVSGTWNRARRIVAKAEYLDHKENPRFVVTSLTASAWPTQALYEKLYCARGDMENRIKEQLSLFAHRVSASTMRANQLRLFLSALSYALLCGLRRLGLRATDLAQAQAATIRTCLLKIGARVRISVRRVWISMASSYPYQRLFEQAWRELRC
jgi:hypothetical protein